MFDFVIGVAAVKKEHSYEIDVNDEIRSTSLLFFQFFGFAVENKVNYRRFTCESRLLR
jgi:hypothetical protein